MTSRRTARVLILLAVQLTLVFALLEGALRLLDRRLPGLNRLLYIPSIRTDFDRIDDLPTLMLATVEGYRPQQRHGDFIYSSRSMRTEEYAGEKRPGVHRIAVLGDSFAHGSGGTPYRQMWTTRLEAEVNERVAREVEVFSLGVGGVGPGFELRLWELERELLRADGVVVGFFVGNDFTDERPETPWRESVARRHSLVVRLIGNATRLWRERALADQWVTRLAATPQQAGGGTVADPSYVRDPSRRRLSDRALLEIVEIDYPQRLVTRLLDEHGIESLDLLPHFRERARSEPLYWLGDTHWNIEGNVLAADVLARRLARWIAEAGDSAD